MLFQLRFWILYLIICLQLIKRCCRSTLILLLTLEELSVFLEKCKIVRCPAAIRTNVLWSEAAGSFIPHKSWENIADVLTKKDPLKYFMVKFSFVFLTMWSLELRLPLSKPVKKMYFPCELLLRIYTSQVTAFSFSKIILGSLLACCSACCIGIYNSGPTNFNYESNRPHTKTWKPFFK